MNRSTRLARSWPGDQGKHGRPGRVEERIFSFSEVNKNRMNFKIVGAVFSAVALGLGAGACLYFVDHEQDVGASQTVASVSPSRNGGVHPAPGTTKTAYDLTVADLERQNPVLNPDSPSFNPAITAAVVSRRDELARGGMNMPDAIHKAVLEFRTAQAADERAARDANARAEQSYYAEQDRRQQQNLAAQNEAYRLAEIRREQEATVAAEMAQQQRFARQQQAIEAQRRAYQRRLATANGLAVSTPVSPGTINVLTGPTPVSQGAINVVTGEFMAPGGPNLISTRNGTVYVPAGPNGYTNTRTGQFVPAH